jgi:predicted metal-dependent HD superfamily phosphohydrolase
MNDLRFSWQRAWLFRRKRRAILRAFLKRPRIFSTQHVNATLEQRARANVARGVAET